MAEKQIYELIGKAMADVGAIGKESVNKQQGFKYRGIDAVMNALNPVMQKYGLFVTPEVLNQTREERQTSTGGRLLYSILTMKYTMYAPDGSNVSSIVIGEGMDSGDKASNEAMAVAMKYAMFQVFCIPTEEMPDPDAEVMPESRPLRDLPKPEKTRPLFVCEECGHELKPYTDGEGKLVSLRAHAERSKAKFGKVLCLDCIKQQ